MGDPVQKVLSELDRAIKDPWGVPVSKTLVWDSFQRWFPSALRQAFDWRGLVLLALAAFGATSLVTRTLNVSLTLPIGETLKYYHALRDAVFTPISLLLAVAVPWWMKDLALIYIRVSTSVWRTIKAFRPWSQEEWDKASANPEFQQFKDPPWLLPRVLWACLAWPWYFVMFGLGRRNPILTYQKLSPVMKLYAAGGGSWATASFYGHAIAHFAANILSILASAFALYAVNTVVRNVF